MKFEWREVVDESGLGRMDIYDLWVGDDSGPRVIGFIYEDHDGRLTFATRVGDLMGPGRHKPPVSDLEEMKAWAIAHVRLKLANGETA